MISTIFHGAVLHGVGRGLTGASSGGVRQAQPVLINARLVDRPLVEKAETNPGLQTSSPGESTHRLPSPQLSAQTSSPVKNVPPAPGKPAAVTAKVSPADSPGVSAPVFERPFAPRYPLQLLIAGVRGAVTVSFRVGRNGGLEDAEIIDSSPPGVFENAVIEALARAQLDIDSVRPNSVWMVTVVFDALGTNAQGPVRQSVLEPKP